MTKNAANQLGKCLSFHYGMSRGRDTYGYTIVTLKVDGMKAAQCNGGGYDMKGTCLGEWMSKTFGPELDKLAKKRAGSVYVKGGTSIYRTNRFNMGGRDKKGNQIYNPNPDYNEAAISGLTLDKETGKALPLDGACGFRTMEDILKALGLALKYSPTSRKDGVYFVVAA